MNMLGSDIKIVLNYSMLFVGEAPCCSDGDDTCMSSCCVKM